MGFPAFGADKSLLGFYATDHSSNGGNGNGGGDDVQMSGGDKLEFLPLSVAKVLVRCRVGERVRERVSESKGTKKKCIVVSLCFS